MRTVAFIGLGIMGLPMALNLHRHGFDVVGFNRTSAKAEPLREAGARVAPTIAEATSAADVIAVNVSDTPDVVEVLRGTDGVFESAKPGALVIDFSTISPIETAELAREAKHRGMRMLDAPVSGGEIGAVEGILSVMVGGDQEDFDDALEVFEAVGRTIVRVGESGAGQTVKAANQLIVAANAQALAEGVNFLASAGVDLKAAVEVLAGGMAGSRIFDQKAEKMMNRDFEPGFKLALHHKDLGIALAAARAVDAPVPLSSVADQLLTAAYRAGDGELDHSAVLRTLLRMSGAEPDSAAGRN